jgi:cytochrome c553
MPKATSLHATCLALLTAPVLGAAEADFFEKRIRPLLAEHCTECHGADKQKGGLRLDHRAGWQQGGDSGPSLVPGDPDTSLIWKVVSYEDRDLKMPPKQKLSDRDLADLRTWIASGAHDPRDTAPGASSLAGSPKADASFWSFQPPVAQPPPAVRQTDWPARSIDPFILAKLEENGLKPAPDADPRILTRRLSFDLTGLPPREEQVEAFAGGKLRYEALVENLLASPAFAERWASHFMDLTRFAESSGGGRSLPFKDAWRFRDYLLESLRDNAPVDRMIREMVAGDLLPARNSAERRRQLTATGFLALGPTNYEEQDKQMLRMDIVDEQLDTIGKSFLGMTIGCARCHDHKFDPISTRDYYALAGILRSTQTLKNYTDNVAHWIDTPLPYEGEQEAQLQAKEMQLASLKAEQTQLKNELRDLSGASLRQQTRIAIDDLPGLVIDDSQAAKVGDWKASVLVKPFIGEGYVHDKTGSRAERTITFTPKITSAGRYEVRVAFIGGPDRAGRVKADLLHADGEETVFFSETSEQMEGLQFASLGTWRFEANGQGFVQITTADADGVVTIDAVQFLPEGVGATPALATGRSGKAEKHLKARLAEVQKQITETEKSGPSRAEVMSVSEDSKPEDARVHIRGSIRNLGAPVPRGFIQAALKGPAPVIPADQSGRLQLADWLTARDQPLTARVFVNRVWQWLFGTGLVRSSDNFGVTGEPPSHPQLLDDLAVRFMEEGWNLKRLVKELVMSRTYRMSSEGSAVESDPDNRLLARMNRKRLDAECLRDAMLAGAGTLDTPWGGPNIADAKAVDSNDTGVQNLEYNHPFNDRRRSVYTAAFRNVRHPLFEVFDFADINQPVAQRTTSTIAPQALYLMNHPQVIELARTAAGRLPLDGPRDAALREAWRLALSRDPDAQERALARDYLEGAVSGNGGPGQVRDAWAQLIQTLWATPEFRFLH